MRLRAGLRGPGLASHDEPGAVELPEAADAAELKRLEDRSPQAALQPLAVEKADVRALGVEMPVELQDRDQQVLEQPVEGRGEHEQAVVLEDAVDLGQEGVDVQDVLDHL